jgi:DNA-directed RNA polymerase specialized sigma24 family protein
MQAQLTAARRGALGVRLPHHIDVDDVVQDVALNLLERQARGDQPLDLPVVHNMARYRALDVLRDWVKYQRRFPQLGKFTDKHDDGERIDPTLMLDRSAFEPMEYAAMSETAKTIGDKVVTLSRQKRRAMVACILGMQAKDAAEALGMGRSNHSAELTYARAALRKMLGIRKVQSS